MKRLLLAIALAFCSITAARSQSAAPVILPAGCGTASFVNNSGYPTVDPQGRACVSPSAGASASPYQFTSSGAGQSQLSVTTGAVSTLTVPAGTLSWTVCVRTGAGTINYSVDGSTATTGATGNLRQLVAGQCVGYSGRALAVAFQAIGATTTTAIDVEYLK